MTRLFRPQRLHRIDGGCPDGGDGASNGGADDKERDYSREDKRIGVTVPGPMDENLVESKVDHKSGCEPTADSDSNAAANDPADVATLPAESHADAELVGALSNGIGDNAVQSDEREGQGEAGEDTEKNGEQT